MNRRIFLGSLVALTLTPLLPLIKTQRIRGECANKIIVDDFTPLPEPELPHKTLTYKNQTFSYGDIWK